MEDKKPLRDFDAVDYFGMYLVLGWVIWGPMIYLGHRIIWVLVPGIVLGAIWVTTMIVFMIAGRNDQDYFPGR